MTTSTVYTADEVATMLRCCRESVYRWIKAGRLESCTRNGTRAHLFTQEHIDAFLTGPAPAEPPAKKPTRNPNRTYTS